MFVGHYAASLAAKAIEPRAPLWTYVIAAQAIDIGWGALVMAGVEKVRIDPSLPGSALDLYHMPFTHSLLGAAAWGIAFGLIVRLICRSGAVAAWAALVVMSHWLLDLLVHRPDLTLSGHPPKLGFGLWNYPWIAMPLELALVGAGFWLFLRNTRGPVGPPLILLAVMVLFQAINWFGPQPDGYSIAQPLTALISYAILFALARWVGTTRRHRRAAGLAMASYRR